MTLEELQAEYAAMKEIYDRVFDDREALLKALRLCVEKGHHDTCSHALSTEYRCDCGYEEGCKVIGNRMSNKGIATVMKDLKKALP